MSCPCKYTTPCDPNCTCVNEFSSYGCSCWCSYGSLEQRKLMAEYLVKAIDNGNKYAAEQNIKTTKEFKKFLEDKK